MSKEPKMSFGAKSLILEITNGKDKGLSRRTFLGNSIKTVAGISILAVSINATSVKDAEALINCSCYANCFTDCHSQCGRKNW